MVWYNEGYRSRGKPRVASDPASLPSQKSTWQKKKRFDLKAKARAKCSLSAAKSLCLICVKSGKSFLAVYACVMSHQFEMRVCSFLLAEGKNSWSLFRISGSYQNASSKGQSTLS